MTIHLINTIIVMKNNYIISKRLLAAILLSVYSIGFYSCQKEIAALPQSIDKAKAGEVLFRKGVLLQVDENDKGEVADHIYPLLDKLDEIRSKAGAGTLFGEANPFDQAINDVIDGIKTRDNDYFSNLQTAAESRDVANVSEVLIKGQDYVNQYLEDVIPIEILKETQNGIEDLGREYLYKRSIISEQDLMDFTKGVNKIIENLESKHGIEAATYAWWHWVVAAVVVVAAAVIGVATIVTTGGTTAVIVAAAALGTVAWIVNWAANNHNK